MIRICCILQLLLLFSACGNPLRSRSEFALGTRVVVQLAPVPGRDWSRDMDGLFGGISAWERVLDPNRKVSLVSAWNRGEQRVFRRKGGRMLDELIRRGADYARRTGGLFDPFILPLTRLWGFSSPLPRKTPPDAGAIAAALAVSGYRKAGVLRGRVILPKGGGFDGGGYLKGWVADRIGQRLKKMGYRRAVIDVGGDIVLIGRRPPQYGSENGWLVMITHPEQAGRYWCSLVIRDRAVVTSGNYERFFTYRGRRYHHLLDPATGYPARGCVSVTVVGPSAETADVLATALFVAGPGKWLSLLSRFPGYSAMLLHKKKGRIVADFSPGFRNKFRYRRSF